MNENLKIYNNVRTVPIEAQKKISGGRLSGMTDINPMWRIKILTETFGVCGFGWRYEIKNQRIEIYSTEEQAAFVDIELFVKVGDKWSEAIPGLGGSRFATKEQKGVHISDECFKMALTDALSVACKSLGIGADIYFSGDKTKYASDTPQRITAVQGKEILELLESAGKTKDDLTQFMTDVLKIESSKDMTQDMYKYTLDWLGKVKITKGTPATEGAANDKNSNNDSK